MVAETGRWAATITATKWAGAIAAYTGRLAATTNCCTEVGGHYRSTRRAAAIISDTGRRAATILPQSRGRPLSLDQLNQVGGYDRPIGRRTLSLD